MFETKEVSVLKVVKEIHENFLLNLDSETINNQPPKEVSDLKVAVSKIIKKHLIS